MRLTNKGSVLKYINMKSRITIEFDFADGNTPVIQILARTSDDVRDKLVNLFLQHLNNDKEEPCSISFKGEYHDETNARVGRWEIKPISKVPE
jgi:hypothetical protein